MKWLFALLVVLLLCGIGVGFARGWFAVAKAPDTDSNKVDIRLTVDPDKMKADTKKVGEKVRELPEKIKQEAKIKHEAEKAGEHEDKGTPGAH